MIFLKQFETEKLIDSMIDAFRADVESLKQNKNATRKMILLPKFEQLMRKVG